MVPQDIQTDTSVRVDVGVIDAGGEVNLGGLERVVGREVDGEEEDTSGVWRVTLKMEKIRISIQVHHGYVSTLTACIMQGEGKAIGIALPPRSRGI